MNRVYLIGKLVRDIDLRYTQTNKAVANFTLACDRQMTREKREEAEANSYPTADFPRVVVWGKQAENASRYLKKGDQCAIEGRIETGSYDDRETGKKVYTTSVIADRVEFLNSSNRSQNYAGAKNNEEAYKYMANENKTHTEQNNDDFFEDDFEEMQDDGRIPFWKIGKK